ncbi:uncharacterized protein PAC_00892 [Phialocephala subalpina]|uniref:Chromo domain-containing protein n=1 Tax=Phialocephala subalpina TaxID=576137 RepID=A0A1L7WE08_9HELO|nr:uncharacterized protein PAC_00892 [Phialocephala subalpina]
MASPHLPFLSERTDPSDTDDKMEEGRLDKILQGQTDKSWEIIGYVVAEVQIRSAAPYTRGSGPPSRRISIMPRHDKTGIILDLSKNEDGKPIYIVGFTDKQALRYGIRAQNILEYVSPRTLENWEIEQERLMEEKRKAKSIAKAQAKAQVKAQVKAQAKTAVEQSELQAVDQSRVTTDTPRGRGRPAKRKRDEEKDLGDISTAGEGLDVKRAGSRKKQALEGTRAAQPSLSSPTQQFDPDNSESNFEDEHTSILLKQQLLGPNSGAPASSGSTSPRPVQTFKKPTHMARDNRSSSRQTRSTSATSVQVPNDRKSTRNQPRRASVAMSSSVEFASVYENLENGKKNLQSKLSEIQPSAFYELSSPAKNRKTSTKSASSKQGSVQPASAEPEQAMAPVDSDEEYEVDYIVDDKYQKDTKGKKVRYYYIKWVGDWPNSWEPETNVGSELVADYKEKRAEQKRSMSTTSSVAREMGENGRAMNIKDLGSENGGYEDMAANGKDFMNGKVKGTEDQHS